MKRRTVCWFQKNLHFIRVKASYLKLEDAPITSLLDFSKLDFLKSMAVYNPAYKALLDLLSRAGAAFPSSLIHILCHSVKKNSLKIRLLY